MLDLVMPMTISALGARTNIGAALPPQRWRRYWNWLPDALRALGEVRGKMTAKELAHQLEEMMLQAWRDNPGLHPGFTARGSGFNCPELQKVYDLLCKLSSRLQYLAEVQHD